MIQLVFDARDAREALDEEPVVGRLQLARGRRAGRAGATTSSSSSTGRIRSSIRRPARTRTSSRRRSTSAARRRPGVGCDDTRGPHVELRPDVETIPSDADAAGRAFPWIAFEGRWGELQRAFFNGPTGPNLKEQWTEPIEWSRGLARRGATPSRPAGVLGTGATDFFCTAVETGSRGLVQLLRSPGSTLLVARGAARARSRAAYAHDLAPVGAAPARAAAQLGPDPRRAGRMYVQRARLFLGIGLLFIPLGSSSRSSRRSSSAASACSASTTTGETAGALVLLVAVGRHDARAARASRRPGRDRVRARRAGRADGTSVRSTPTGSRSRGSGRCSAASRSQSPSASVLDRDAS